MEWLNYHHLFYFWTVAKEGTVSAAAAQLHLARPTVTAQVRELENSIGQKLFQKQGRGLVLTEFGQQVFRYAEEIFSIGHQLREFVKTGQSGNRKRFRVGMPDVVPKLIAFELLKPALQDPGALLRGERAPSWIGATRRFDSSTRLHRAHCRYSADHVSGRGICHFDPSL